VATHALFKGITAAVVTISDSCVQGRKEDVSGEVLVGLLKARGAHVLRKEVLPDDKLKIKKCLKFTCDTLKIKLVVTTGGTGLGPRDVTPEATREVLEKEVPGLMEWARLEGSKQTRNAALSRAVAGVRKNSLIINFPGSPRGVEESFRAVADVIPHAFAMMRGEGHGEKKS
jgi:molybdenum cofactor synthesis domain-containing protein